MKPALQTTPKERTSLTVSQWIKASPERIYAAFTTPEEMSRWFGPKMAARPPQVEAVAQPDGAYRIVTERTDGTKSIVYGKYRELVPGKKISFTWGWEAGHGCSGGTPSPMEPHSDESVVTIVLSEKNGGTDVTITHERLPDTQSTELHTGGWTTCLQNLAALVSKA
jgi:uncharacterized protein YndB with AHSA1/START domain